MSEEQAQAEPVPVEETQGAENTEAETTTNDAESHEEAPTQETQVEEESVETKYEKAQKRLEAQEQKIRRQTKSYAQMQKNFEETRKQLEEFTAQQQKTEESTEAPKLDDFDSYDEFLEAAAEYKAKEKFTKLEQEKKQAEMQAQYERMMQERAKNYEAMKADFVQNVPDYQEAEEEFMSFTAELQGKVNPATQDAFTQIAYAENAVPQLIHYFGAEHGARMNELIELSQKNPALAAVETYKLVQKLKSTPQAKKEPKQPPKPPSRVNATGTTRKDLMQGDVLKNLGLKQLNQEIIYYG